MTEELEK